MKKFLLSVIIPVFNEEKNIDPLLKRLIPVLKNYSYEIIFVDDGSTDNTLKTLKSFSQKNNNIKIISFLRNFGHQMALYAGYQNAKGDVIISIDADLQDPPELIDQMIEKWQKGGEIIYAKRQQRLGESFFKLKTAEIFYKLLNFLSDREIPQQVGDFRLIDKKVLDYLKNIKEAPNFIRGLVAWPGFKTDYVYFVREKRNYGKSHYSFFKMVNFALDGIASFSIKPLRLSSYLGFFVSLIGFLGIIYKLIEKLLHPERFTVGWTGLFTAIIFLGGIQLITIGILGEYIGKIYEEIKQRPRYLIKEKINF